MFFKVEHKSSPKGNASKLVVITGCDSGFGRMTAIRLHELGFSVVACCLDASKASQETFKVPSQSSNFRIVQLDVTNDEMVANVVQFVEMWLNQCPQMALWAIVNNAGIMQAMVPTEFLTMESARRIFEVNFFGPVKMAKAFLPLLRKHKGSRFVNTSSIVAEMAPLSVNMAMYCASKSAALAVFDNLSCELQKFNIHVAAVCPDFYKTEIANSQNILQNFDAELSKCSKHVTDCYGGDDFKTKLRCMAEHCPEMANPNLNPVVESLTRAVTDKVPKRRYFPISGKTRFMRWIYKVAPEIVSGIVSPAHRI